MHRYRFLLRLTWVIFIRAQRFKTVCNRKQKQVIPIALIQLVPPRFSKFFFCLVPSENDPGYLHSIGTLDLSMGLGASIPLPQLQDMGLVVPPPQCSRFRLARSTIPPSPQRTTSGWRGPSRAAGRGHGCRCPTCPRPGHTSGSSRGKGCRPIGEE